MDAQRVLRILNILVVIFVAITVLLFFYNMYQTPEIRSGYLGRSHFRYSTVGGYFQQSEKDTDSERFDFRKENFGLIDREYETDAGDVEGKKGQWQRFERFVRHVNEKSPAGVQYKVLFLGRHGQGWHNVAEEKYGTAAWDCYWSMLDGAEGMTWADANLTAVGHEQAVDVHGLWKSLVPNGIPTPETFYVSPLTRAIETADISFQGLGLPKDRPYKPIVKELLREAIGVHTCDRRRTASEIQTSFSHLSFESGFSEDDPLWTSDFREPRGARRYRLAQLLDDVFTHDDGVFLSFTSHSGAIGSILEVIGHREFGLETGGVIPVFVKAERVSGERRRPPDEPSEGPPACTTSPTALPN